MQVANTKQPLISCRNKKNVRLEKTAKLTKNIRKINLFKYVSQMLSTDYLKFI